MPAPRPTLPPPTGSRRRPVIGVTGPVHGGEAAWMFTRLALAIAGATARRITPAQPCCVDDVDGLILGGGADVDPKLYGQSLPAILAVQKPAHRSLGGYLIDLILFPLTWIIRKAASLFAYTGKDTSRDALEMRLLDEALERGLPVLGICRGAQLLNVHFGGSLHQDLSSFYVEDRETRSILPRKRVVLEPGSTLARLIGAPAHRVNALHRQAIDRVGRELKVCVRDRNGIVQGIEHARLPFVLGVQWHPEYLPQIREQRAIFRALVEEARSRSVKRRTAGARHPEVPRRVSPNRPLEEALRGTSG